MVTDMYYTKKDQMIQLANNTRENEKDWQYITVCIKTISKSAIKHASPD